MAEAHRTYWRYEVHSLAAGQEVPAGEFADHLVASGAPVLEQDDNTPDVDGDGVPDGSAKDVLGWVGDDPARAALALQAESRRGSPRKALTADLEKIASKGAVDGQPEG